MTPARGIAFSGPMVLAVLADIKTQTRRIERLRPPYVWGERDNGSPWPWDSTWAPGDEGDGFMPAPYQVGDRLWVRETFRYEPCGSGVCAMYKADDAGLIADTPQWRSLSAHARSGRWISPRFMPRWASRRTLEVTGFRYERLQSLSEEDALAEGVTKVRDACYVVRGHGYDKVGLCHTDPITAFATLWDRVNDKPGCRWEDNPIVRVISFRKSEP